MPMNLAPQDLHEHEQLIADQFANLVVTLSEYTLGDLLGTAMIRRLLEGQRQSAERST